jgi:adenosylcobinamide kinase/adenosylcobinamide-phosphate guanylyltransferase
LARRAAPTVVVSSEVGLSIVPENALARAFRDAAGELNQDIARIAGKVVLLVASYPVMVK